MNLRTPIVAAVVLVAGGAAAVRALHPNPAPPALTIESSPGPSAPEPAKTERSLRTHDAHIVVYVAGEVRRGGLYDLPPSARAADALRAAGGATQNADLVAVNLAQPLADGDEVAVPALGAAPATTRTARSHHKHHKKNRHRKRTTSVSDAGDATGPSTVVDLNTANESELETLPGIGPELAQRIVAFRERTGPYATSDDLLDVAGMTQSKLDALTPYVEVTR
jgi:competence protein ComEA